MNTAVYHDPYKLPAGILALIVHGLFFGLLYFGFSWQSEPVHAVPMSVVLWKSLPDTRPVMHEKAKPVEQVPPPVKEVEVIKPDIVIPDKKPEKKPEIKPVEKPVEKPKVKPAPEVKKDIKPEVKKMPEVKQTEVQKPVVSDAEQRAAHDKAEQEAATGKAVEEFVGKIRGKIKRNIVMPPDVPDNVRAEFLVTLLPGGSVLSARLTKSSGNTAYDNAVERAILRSDPLPLPPDAALFSRFRELKLSFKPVE